MSDEALQLIDERQQLVTHGAQEQVKNISKETRKTLRRNKRKYMQSTLDRDLDEKDRWVGIEQIRNIRKDEEGRTVGVAKQGEAAADF